MKKSNALLYFTVLIFLLAACNGKEEKLPEKSTPAVPAEVTGITVSQAQFDASGMELGKMVNAVFPSVIRVNGHVDVPPKSKAVISAYYGGYVKGLNLLPGQRIRKGQLLFTLENPEFLQMQQDFLEASAQLKYLQADFERQKILASENIASQKNFLKAESDYKVQQARSEGLRKKLQLIGMDLERVEAGELISAVGVFAPISGSVSTIKASSGSYLQPSDVALEITNSDHLHLELDVFEKDVHLLREGQLIRFRLPGAPGKNLRAKVHLIGSLIESEARVVRVHGHLENEAESRQLIPGMYIEAEIETAADSVLALPEEAIVSSEDAAFVLVQDRKSSDGYHFERMPIQSGRTANGMVEIKTDQTLLQNPILVKGGFNLIMDE